MQKETIEDPFQAAQRRRVSVEQEAVVASDAVAFADLRSALGQLRDSGELAGTRPHTNPCGDRIAQSSRVKVETVAPDHSEAFESSDPAGYSRGGYPDVARQCRLGLSRVLIERDEQFTIDVVNFAVCRHPFARGTELRILKHRRLRSLRLVKPWTVGIGQSRAMTESAVPPAPRYLRREPDTGNELTGGRRGRSENIREPIGTDQSSQRAAFEVPRNVAYFNTANLSPMLRSVRAAGDDALQRRAEPWNITTQDWFTDVERLRSLYGALIGAEADAIALIPATSYGFAVAAHNIALRSGQRVLVLAEEYPSGVYTWQAATRATDAEVLTVHRRSGQNWTEAVMEALDERVAVVSVPHVHWTDGSLLDLVTIGARAREVGACLVIDGSQSIGALPLDVGAIRPDYVISVGYKWLLGPFGLGYLYIAEEYRSGQPIEHNWILREGAEDFTRLVDYRDDYQPGARRFDVGERTNFELVPMAVAALEQLHAWGVYPVHATLSAITGQIAARVSQLGLDPLPPGQRSGHMLGVSLPERGRAEVLPALTAAGCYASIRGQSLRLAPHLHVTGEDIDRLLHALESALQRG